MSCQSTAAWQSTQSSYACKTSEIVSCLHQKCYPSKISGPPPQTPLGAQRPPPLQYVIVHTILPPSPVILWKELGGKPKWLPLKFGYHDVMHTNPIIRMKIFFHSIVCVNFTKRPNGRNFRKLSDKVYLQTLPVFCHDHDVQKQSPFCLATANRRCEFRSRTDGLRLVPSQVEMQVYLVIMSKSFAGDRIASAIRYCYTSETI